MGKNIPRAQSFKNNIDRALHNLYQEKRTTLHPMTAVPIYYRRMFKGDVFDFGIAESLLQSEPTFAPLMANWRLEFQWYFDSDANRYGWIDNNTRLTAQEVMNRKHHRFVTTCVKYSDDLNETPDFEIGRGSLFDFAGVPPMFTLVRPSDSETSNFYGGTFNIDFHLTYLNIIRNYHINKQFPNIPYIALSYESDGTDRWAFDTYSLEDMDNLFLFLRSCPNGILIDSQMDRTGAPPQLETYYSSAVNKFIDYLDQSQRAMSGLFCTQFEPDLYQNLLANDMNLLRSTISVEDGGFTIEQFRLKNHLQGLYDKIFVSGGTDRDLSRTIWGIESNRDYDIPELLCVHSEIIGTNLITSSTAGESTYNNEDISNVPGSLSGNINTRRNGGRLQKFTAKTSGSLMCIVTLTPLVDYTQNIERHLLEHNFMDEFTPDMARKGFEDVPLSDYCALPWRDSGDYLVTSLDTSVGKQVAWLREMTAVNRAHGEFSNGGEKADWVLRRDFRVFADYDSSIISSGFTPYGNPLDFQYPFVSTTLYDPNFYLQVGFVVKAYRPIPRRIMPNLGY